jgi:hypothetical protein
MARPDAPLRAARGFSSVSGALRQQTGPKQATGAEMSDDEMHEESPWRYPLIIIIVTLALSGIVAYTYFGPSLEDLRGDTPEASARETPIHMEIGDSRFVIPENYTQYPRARRGGPRDSVALYAVFPTFEPYSVRHDRLFFENEPDNPIVYFEIHLARLPMTEQERIDQIYRERLADDAGEELGYGLTQYAFDSDSSYADEDLFLGQDEDGNEVAIICTKISTVVPSPNCRRDLELSDGLRLSYRFKRAHLERWREINTGLLNLVDAFRAP